MNNISSLRFLAAVLGGVCLALSLAACLSTRENANGGADNSSSASNERSLFNSNSSEDTTQQPTIEVAPVEAGEGGYRVITSDTVTFTVRAAAAEKVSLLYQPVTAADRFVTLRTLDAPQDRFSDRFETQFKPPADLNGEVWARVSYTNGETKQTERIRLAARDDSSSPQNNQAGAANNSNSAASYSNTANKAAAANTNRGADRTSNAAAAGKIEPDESARSDKATGGRIRRGALREGTDELRLTLNVPAFLLTLWQGDREVATYPVGVGRENFPVPIEERTTSRIILNPAWIPPDSEWVRSSSSVEPYERIPASDPRNPLGKIKLPLGNAYLIHEAQAPSDIGNLVSHGCVRVLSDDLFDLVKKIARARALPISNEEIDQTRNTSERRVVELDRPLTIDINYDTHVIEGGVLNLYPDVYNRGTNTVERLRAELEDAGIPAERLDDATLRAMLEQVSAERKYVVAAADIRRGRAAERGRTEPLTPQQADGNKK